MKTLNELRQAVRSAIPIETAGSHHQISDIDFASYNPRQKTISCEIEAYCGYVREKISNIQVIAGFLF